MQGIILDNNTFHNSTIYGINTLYPKEFSLHMYELQLSHHALGFQLYISIDHIFPFL